MYVCMYIHTYHTYILTLCQQEYHPRPEAACPLGITRRDQCLSEKRWAKFEVCLSVHVSFRRIYACYDAHMILDSFIKPMYMCAMCVLCD